MNAMPKTDLALIRRLEESAKQPRSREELTAQRVSFVFGNLPTDSTITRAQVEERIREKAGY